MNFQKGFKQQLIPPPTPTSQNGPHLWQSSACISYYLALVPSLIYLTISIIKYLQHNFPKMRGVEDRLEFFRNFIRFGAAILPLPLHLITGLKNVKLIIWWTLTAIQNDHPAFDTYLGHVSSAWQFTFLFPLRRPGWKCRMTSVIFIISYMYMEGNERFS